MSANHQQKLNLPDIVTNRNLDGYSYNGISKERFCWYTMLNSHLVGSLVSGCCCTCDDCNGGLVLDKQQLHYKTGGLVVDWLG